MRCTVALAVSMSGTTISAWPATEVPSMVMVSPVKVS
jgi:hypothetical protein